MNIRRALYRSLYTVKGADPYRFISEIESMTDWDKERLRNWQSEKIFLLFEHSSRHVPYYRNALDSIGLRDFQSSAADLIEKFPILTRASLRSNFDELKARDGWRNVVKRSTSGSTGSPLTIIRDSFQNSWTQAAKLRSYRWYGCELDDPAIVFTGTSKVIKTRLLHYLLDLFLGRLRVSSFDQSPQRMENIARMIIKKKFPIVAGYPSAIYNFCKYCDRHKIDLSGVRVRLVVPTAEMLYDFQKELMEHVFKAPVMNEYGCIETGSFAFSCSRGSLHLLNDIIYLEILDDDGRQCRDGEVGYVTLTPLMARAMPLIRYQNGDTASIVREPCECGFQAGMPMLKDLRGRARDVIRTTEGREVHASIIGYAAKAALCYGVIEEYQIEQIAFDKLILRYIRGDQFSEDAIAKFVSIILSELGSQFDIELFEVEEIIRGESGKYRYFISNV